MKGNAWEPKIVRGGWGGGISSRDPSWSVASCWCNATPGKSNALPLVETQALYQVLLASMQHGFQSRPPVQKRLWWFLHCRRETAACVRYWISKLWLGSRGGPHVKTSPHSLLMTGLIEISAMASTSSLVAAGPGRGCAGRCDLEWSCHRGELCERRRKKRIQTLKEEEFRAGSMNFGTMRGRSAEIVETATRRRLDCGFLQETKWKGVLCPSQSRSQVRWLKGKDSVHTKYFGPAILRAQTE